MTNKETTYTESQIREAWYNLDYQPLGLNMLITYLKSTNKSEYQQYLELKAKFES